MCIADTITAKLADQFGITCSLMRDSLRNLIVADAAAIGLHDEKRQIAASEVFGYNDIYLSKAAEQYLEYRDFYLGL